MKDSEELGVPAHLEELLQPTPSGTAKLVAAWDGLTAETQISILAAKKKRSGPAYLYSRIIDKALKSENAFVRYMAARETRYRDDDQRGKNLKTQIENDPEPLVRYANLEGDSGPLFDSEMRDPEKFFALPHEARLAKVRRLTGQGEGIAKIITCAVEHQLKEGRISEIELFEILSDYLNKPEFKSRHADDRFGYDGWGKFTAGKDIESLWELVLKVPENISHVIIELLPECCPDLQAFALDKNDPALGFYRPEKINGYTCHRSASQGFSAATPLHSA